jgi:cell wall-associated NlpC family hydrolase
MAPPSSGARRRSARSAAPTARRAVVVLAGVFGILLSAMPAQAAPATAAEAGRLMAARAHDLEVLTEKFDTARETLAAQEAAVQAATVKMQAATAALVVAQHQVRGVARSAFTGDGTSPFRALLTSRNAADFVGRVTTLDTIAGRQDAILKQAAGANVVAAQAQAAARKSAAAAKAQYDAVAAQQATLKAQVAEFQAAFAKLTAQEQQAAIQPPVRASRADRAPAAAAPAAAAPAATAAPGPILAGSKVAQTVVDAAMAQRGKPYVWAASGPGSFDCSGLVDYAFSAAGIGLPHSSAMQYRMGQAVSRAQLQPGDLVFFYSPVSHVGIYIGNGQMVHAPTAGDVVKVSSIDAMGFFAGGRRIG